MAAPIGLEQKIQKKVLSAGKRLASFADGAKIYFHYKTQLCDEVGTVLDDSRVSPHHHDHDHDHAHDHGHAHNHDKDHAHCKDHAHEEKKPMELIVGKKFKLEAWELCLKNMSVGELAQFRVHKSLCPEYPLVAKSLRDLAQNKVPEHQHMCGMRSLQEKTGCGYKDLDDLTANPQDLLFTFEITDVQEPGNYEKDTWTMDDEEKHALVPSLREKGNQLYKDKLYQPASDTYAKAIGLLEELMLKEKPHCPEWLALQEEKEPLLLNFSQCRLLLEDYYPVIEHTSTVLETNPENVKALYRRAKAHVGAWNPREAIQDFEKVMELDPTLTNTVKKELRNIVDIQCKRDAEDSQKLKGMFE